MAYHVGNEEDVNAEGVVNTQMKRWFVKIMIRPHEEFPWMVGWLWSRLAPSYILLSMSPLTCGNKPKVLVASEVYHVVVTSNTLVNREAVLLEGNIQKWKT
jgi:hypothetical protein